MELSDFFTNLVGAVMCTIGTYLLDATLWSFIPIGTPLMWAIGNGVFAFGVLTWMDLTGATDRVRAGGSI
jgi:hypothetical protein